MPDYTIININDLFCQWIISGNQDYKDRLDTILNAKDITSKEDEE